MIRKLLVANRGEVARRVFRTCREMGIATVAVFSEPDRHAPHVDEADEGFALGGSAPADSYLRIESILTAARRTGADAVHPGYGFLAENAGFAAAVLDAGLRWVGPPPKAIELMGSKLESKRLISQSGVPTLASLDLTGVDPSEYAAAAETTGYPVLVKASAGGGGKGMRIVRHPGDLAEAVESARREAGAAFGDDTVFLERYLDSPRHVEIQVFADDHDHTVALHERECSIQRRHQKIIEECPSPAVTADLRERMGRAAMAAARTVDYRGAGTVEFLLQDGEFTFLEMNTRLQVEHPVTEEVTGLDLVRLQLLVAAGQPLPEEALEPALVGHAIEARLYAEDPRNQFLPQTGTLHRFRFPSATGLRVDSGVEDGSVIGTDYDPMLAKVIGWGETRSEAAALLADGLQRAEIHGVVTNRDLLVRILSHPQFLAGGTDTNFLERHSPIELGRPLPTAEDEKLAAVAAALASQVDRRGRTRLLPQIPSGWRNNPSELQQVQFRGEAGVVSVGYRVGGSEPIVEIDGVRLPAVEVLYCQPDRVGLITDFHLRWFRVHRVDEVHYVDGPSGATRLVELARFPIPEAVESPGSLHAPMPGKVIRVEAEPGQQVEPGETLVVIEAMKMEHTLRAPRAGTVTAVGAVAGDQVTAEQILVVIVPTEAAAD